MKMLVGGDDRRRYLGSREQLPIIGGHEIRAHLVGDEFGPIRLDLRESDEVALGMSRRDLATEQPDPPGADDGQTDAFGIFFHRRTLKRPRVLSWNRQAATTPADWPRPRGLPRCKPPSPSGRARASPARACPMRLLPGNGSFRRPWGRRKCDPPLLPASSTSAAPCPWSWCSGRH